jgi:hypothetical protein
LLTGTIQQLEHGFQRANIWLMCCILEYEQEESLSSSRKRNSWW